MRVMFPAMALAALVACDTGGTLHEDLELVHDGVTRTYHLYEPDARVDFRPLVLVLHGGGGSSDQVLGVGLNRSPHEVWLDVAAEEGLYVAAPQGLGDHWNDCRAPCDRCGDADDEGFLTALVDELVATRDVDPDRVYVLGESNGGFMTQRLALQAPERFAGFGAVIAQLPATSQCTPVGVPVSIQYQLGTEDPYVLYDGGQAGGDPALNVLSAADTATYWVGINGCDSVATSTYDDLDPDDGAIVVRDDHTCGASGTAVSVLHVQGGGHVASSVDVEVTAAWEALVGPQDHDIESARELWAFFEGLSR